MTNLLPSDFADLEPFVAQWAKDSQAARVAARQHALPGDMEAFFAATFPRLKEILGECDRFPLGELPATHRPLFALALSIAEIATNVEIYSGATHVPFAFQEQRLLALHDQQPTWYNLSPTRVVKTDAPAYAPPP